MLGHYLLAPLATQRIPFTLPLLLLVLLPSAAIAAVAVGQLVESGILNSCPLPVTRLPRVELHQLLCHRLGLHLLRPPQTETVE